MLRFLARGLANAKIRRHKMHTAFIPYDIFVACSETILTILREVPGSERGSGLALSSTLGRVQNKK